MQKLLSYLVIGSVSLLATTRPSLACSCLPTTPETAKQQANVVFTGRVIRQQTANNERDRLPEANIVWTFLVDDVEKGRAPRRLRVESPQSSAACGFNFQLGGRYRVYAQRDGKTLRTSLCSGNEQLQTAGNPRSTLPTTISATACTQL